MENKITDYKTHWLFSSKYTYSIIEYRDSCGKLVSFSDFLAKNLRISDNGIPYIPNNAILNIPMPEDARVIEGLRERGYKFNNYLNGYVRD